MRTIVSLLLCFCLAFPVFGETATFEAQPTPEAQTQPAHNFWQEFDIVFWQGLPWITIWTHFAERQIAAQNNPGSSANWQVVLSASTVLSAINAYRYAYNMVEVDKNGK